MLLTLFHFTNMSVLILQVCFGSPPHMSIKRRIGRVPPGGRQHYDGDGLVRAAGGGHGDPGERSGAGLRVHGHLHGARKTGTVAGSLWGRKRRSLSGHVLC